MSDAAGVAQQGRPGLVGSVPFGRLWLAVTLFLIALLLVLAAWMWWLRVPPIVTRILPAPAAELAPETAARAEALRHEIDAMERELATERANAESIACPPGQRIKEGALPAAPGTVAAAVPAGSLPALASGALADLLERATALVLTEKGIGTGFFIAPNLLVTNRHVVEGATDGDVFVTSRSLGSARPGVVLRMTASGKPGAEDLALVRMTVGTAPATVTLSDQAPKLSPVVAAGYPGLILQNDTGFRRMIGGDIKATPDLSLTQGVVQSLQNSPQGVPVLVHTASVLKGNSGGPLVDACGRVVGVNTFIAVDAEQSGRVSYAQTTGVLERFLNDSGARIPVDGRACPQP